MPRHHAPQQKGRSKVGSNSDANSELLASRPFAPSTQPKASEQSSVSSTLERTPATFSLANSAGGPALPIQTQLTIGAPGDKYEQEADQIARQVVQRIESPEVMGDSHAIQRHEHPDEEGVHRKTLEEEDELQMKPSLQMHGSAEATTAHPDLEASIRQAKGGGFPLDTGTRESMEQAFGGTDFRGVTIHTDTQSDQLNRSIQAIAFTTGQDIFFQSGAYDPGSRSGKELLAHELTHVVQQNGHAVQRHKENEDVQRKSATLQTKSETCTAGCQCASCTSGNIAIQRRSRQDDATNPLQSSLLDSIGASGLSSAIQTHPSSQTEFSDRPLKQVQQQSSGIQRFASTHTATGGCACPTCTGAGLQIQQKSEQAHSPGCSCSMCSGQEQVQAKYSPELQRHTDEEPLAQRKSTHEVQVSVNHISSHAGQPTTAAILQRHTAYEHYLLGQVEPSKLANLPMVREIPQLEKEFEDVSKQIKKAQSTNKLPEAQALFNKLQTAKGKKEEVRHTLEQEMNRLWEFKSNPEAIQNREEDIGKVEKGQDDKWQVPIVKLPVKGDGPEAVAGDTSIIVSYSEINTFPDFFGNPETIANTPKSKVLSLLQGVRQQSYIELSNLYKEIFGEDKNKLADWTHRENLGMTEGDFQGAVGPRGQAVNEWAYEKRTEMQVQGATERSEKSEKSQEYFAALERNACHFAPYSWTQWEKYHQEARRLATASALRKQNIADMRELNGDEGVIANEEKIALEEGNQALLQNAFGEHYLQDSFAAGHLIDKTGVMQAFTKWINTNGNELGSSEKFKAQWAMASMIANKQGTNNDLQSNPQALDDKMMRGELNSVGDATSEVGLGATEDIVFMMWWRNAANAKGSNKHLTPQQAAQKCPIPGVAGNANKARELMDKLVTQSFAKKKTEGIIKKVEVYSINQIHVDVLKGKGAYQADLAMKLHEDGTHDYVKEAEEFNLAAYNAFLSNAYIQGATKYFHDKYCREGLEVITGTNEAIGRIYGDAKMLSGGGQQGVEYSATTSQMSREAIFNIMNGRSDLAASVNDIRNRFPTKVVVPGIGPRTLENWNYQFLYTNESFKEAASTAAKIAYKAMEGGGISGGNAINVGEIVKHDGDVF